MKKVVARFDKNIAAWRKKSIDDPREECITANPEEEPNTEDSMKNLLLRTLKRFLPMRNQNENFGLGRDYFYATSN